MRNLTALIFAACLVLPANAQDQTLADIRQELTVLFQDVQVLKRELSTTGGVATSVGGDTLQRVDQIERALQRLTARTEELEFRISSVVRDGTNRVGDLEFRLCELEEGCDIGALGDTPMLGGPAPEPATQTGGTTTTEAASDDSAQLAVGEEADFTAAAEAFQNSEFESSARLLQNFVDNYPGSPLAGEALVIRGMALQRLDQHSTAARSFIDAFSREPDGKSAPDALTELGKSLAQLGQVSEACKVLAEVGVRFPGNVRVADAEAELARLTCQ